MVHLEVDEIELPGIIESLHYLSIVKPSIIRLLAPTETKPRGQRTGYPTVLKRPSKRPSPRPKQIELSTAVTAEAVTSWDEQPGEVEDIDQMTVGGGQPKPAACGVFRTSPDESGGMKHAPAFKLG